MSKIYGYLRISTAQQNIDSNKAEILLFINKKGLGNEIEWVEEVVSGTKHYKQRVLGKVLIPKLEKDDIIVMSEISRIGRTINQVMSFCALLAEKEVKLYCTKTDFKIDDSIQSQMLIFAYGLSAQIERELISARTKSALANAKANGKKIGRPKGSGKKKLDPYKEEIKSLVEMGVKLKVIAKKYAVTPKTMSSYVKLHKMK